MLDAKNHFLSQTSRFFQHQQRWCRTYSWRQTKLLSKLSEGRPSILLGPFFLKVQCHLFARISLDQMGAVILSTDAILLQNFPNKKQNKTILASLCNTVSIYESMGSGQLDTSLAPDLPERLMHLSSYISRPRYLQTYLLPAFACGGD